MLAPVVFTVTVAVPLADPELRVTVCPPVQVGRSVAPVGDAVTAQLRLTVPAYPVVELTVICDVPDAPGEMVTAAAVTE
jgi:hypothetical protein